MNEEDRRRQQAEHERRFEARSIYRDSRDRMMNDADFRAAVESLAQLAERHGYTPGEMKQLAFCASCLVEQRSFHPMLVVEAPKALGAFISDGFVRVAVSATKDSLIDSNGVGHLVVGPLRVAIHKRIYALKPHEKRGDEGLVVEMEDCEFRNEDGKVRRCLGAVEHSTLFTDGGMWRLDLPRAWIHDQRQRANSWHRKNYQLNPDECWDVWGARQMERDEIRGLDGWAMRMRMVGSTVAFSGWEWTATSEIEAAYSEHPCNDPTQRARVEDFLAGGRN